MSWTQIGSDFTGSSEGDQLGRNISISADGTVLAMATDPDTITIYERSGNSWNVQDTIAAAVGDSNFAKSLELSGDGNRIVFGLNTNGRNCSYL